MNIGGGEWGQFYFLYCLILWLQMKGMRDLIGKGKVKTREGLGSTLTT